MELPLIIEYKQKLSDPPTSNTYDDPDHRIQQTQWWYRPSWAGWTHTSDYHDDRNRNGLAVIGCSSS